MVVRRKNIDVQTNRIVRLIIQNIKKMYPFIKNTSLFFYRLVFLLRTNAHIFIFTKKRLPCLEN